MNNDLLKYIGEYFKTFNRKDYTIYVNGKWTKWCNATNNRIVWNIPSDNNEMDWHAVYGWEIAEVTITATSMTVKKINGGERIFVAKVKTKEEKVKEIIPRMKNALNEHNLDTALDYLEELEELMNE